MSPDASFSTSETEETYDSWSEWFPYIYGTYEEGVDYFYKTIGLTMKKYQDGGRILDAGCGVGLTSGGLLKAGFRVTGLDLSSKSIERCRRLIESYGDRASFVVANLLDIPPDIGGYDGVAATTAILSHFLTENEQLTCLRQMAGTLKPGGMLLLSTSDYRARLDREPDDFCTQPVRCWDENQQEFLYFQRRIWSGIPRERIYKSMYYRIKEDLSVQRMALTMNAITADEIDALLDQTGFSSVEWLSVAQTGFHKEICIAEKR